MSDKSDWEIDWQAFLYVSGEMSPETAEVFEARLADDQEAREAVAHAVELLTKLAAVPFVAPQTMPAGKVPSHHAPRFAGIATTAALVLVCWLLVHTSNSPDDTSGDAARQLVSFWAESGSATENGSTSEHDTLAGDDESDLAVPSWMLAAVESKLPKPSEEN